MGVVECRRAFGMQLRGQRLLRLRRRRRCCRRVVVLAVAVRVQVVVLQRRRRSGTQEIRQTRGQRRRRRCGGSTATARRHSGARGCAAGTVGGGGSRLVFDGRRTGGVGVAVGMRVVVIVVVAVVVVVVVAMRVAVRVMRVVRRMPEVHGLQRIGRELQRDTHRLRRRNALRQQHCVARARAVVTRRVPRRTGSRRAAAGGGPSAACRLRCGGRRTVGQCVGRLRHGGGQQRSTGRHELPQLLFEVGGTALGRAQARLQRLHQSHQLRVVQCRWGGSLRAGPTPTGGGGWWCGGVRSKHFTVQHTEHSEQRVLVRQREERNGWKSMISYQTEMTGNNKELNKALKGGGV